MTSAAELRPIRTRAMCAFTRRVDKIVGSGAQPQRIATEVAGCLGELLTQPRVLAPAHLLPSPESYRQHLVYVDPGGRFSVVSLVWLPGQRTPIHNHRCWCVVGVLRGVEEEVRFDLDPRSRSLHRRDVVTNQAGSVSALVPPERDIHLVRNSGSTLAVSVHVYGADIGRLGSSIDTIYSAG
ncbi:cysteine dioxygenase [Crossiella sp. NPDC003009]